MPTKKTPVAKKTIAKRPVSKKAKVQVFERDEYDVRFIEAPAREKTQGPGGVVMYNVRALNTNPDNTVTEDIKPRTIEWVASTDVPRSALQAFRPMGHSYSGRS